MLASGHNVALPSKLDSVAQEASLEEVQVLSLGHWVAPISKSRFRSEPQQPSFRDREKLAMKGVSTTFFVAAHQARMVNHYQPLECPQRARFHLEFLDFLYHRYPQNNHPRWNLPHLTQWHSSSTGQQLK